MFYVGGIAEQAIGESAPWVIIGVMLFAFCIRSIYLESCSMYVRGGVYVVVRDSLGPFPAKLSVSALVVDYVLTGPISSVTAGHYFAGLINNIAECRTWASGSSRTCSQPSAGWPSRRTSGAPIFAA
jgi:amino acid transporter